MTLIHPAMLLGLGLVAIPIILHFLMRQKPKKLMFPALRLIQVRQRNNVRRMRIRHFWLLLLRMAVIAMLVFALTRPSLPAADYALSGWEFGRLLLIVSAAVGVYFAMMRLWQSQRLPHHVLSYRRSLLRGGAAAAAVSLLLLLVIWPYWRRVSAELSSPQKPANENVPIAAVFLFDTSASMDYRLESLTRLERAQNLAEQYLERLTPRSRVAVVESSSDSPVLFQGDLTSARTRLRGLKTTAVSRSLNTRVRAALLALEDDRRRTLEQDSDVPVEIRQDRFAREVYVFTDFSRSAWRTEEARQLHAEMERLPWASVYLIDVGVKQAANVGISAVRLSRQTLTEGGDLTVEATLEAAGVESAARTLEVLLSNESGGTSKKGQSTVTVDTQSGAKVAFALTGLAGPLVQGELRLAASDPFSHDDVRYFTAVVRPRPEILLVSNSVEETVYWREALAPAELERLGKARYQCQYLPTSRLAQTDLAKYDGVCLFNVSALTEAEWNQLKSYVNAGGGLAVFLGDSRIDPVSYNSPAAQALLPGELLAQLRFRGEVFLDLKNLSHPILQKFEELGGVGELSTVPVFRHWRVQPEAGSTTLVHYTDDRETPALLERPMGQGRVVMLTTAVDLRGWSELPLARWSFVAMADQMMQYLGRMGEGTYSYSAGEAVFIPFDRRQAVKQYLLRKPGLEQLPGTAPDDGQVIPLDGMNEAGHYQVLGSDEGSQFKSGFSVNVPAGESDFTRIGTADLDVMLGEKRYRIAEDLGSLERIVSTGRLGQEMFPFLVIFLVGAFLFEHLAANFFYDSEQAAVHR